MRHNIYCLWALICRYISMPRNIIFSLVVGLRPDWTWNFSGLPWIRIGGRKSTIQIGRRFSAVSNISNNSFGIIQRVMIRTVGHEARIVIGDDVGVSGCTISAAQSITIGNHVLVGSGAIICDTDAHPVSPEERRKGGKGACAPIVVEDDVFIGARAIVLKGVTIGKGSVIGAGAVVTKSIPSRSIAVGNPAHVVRHI